MIEFENMNKTYRIAKWQGVTTAILTPHDMQDISVSDITTSTLPTTIVKTAGKAF